MPKYLYGIIVSNENLLEPKTKPPKQMLLFKIIETLYKIKVAGNMMKEILTLMSMMRIKTQKARLLY